MQELLRNAWMGWQNYIDAGKYVVFVLVIIMLFWFGQSKSGNETQNSETKGVCKAKTQRKQVLFLYTTVMVAACIFPVTAAVLMVYQTRFYDYQWIWSLVPVTLLIGIGLVEGYLDYVEQLKMGAKVVLAILVVGIMVLAGRMAAPIMDSVENEQKVLAEAVIEQVKGRGNVDNICLWAPKNIMTYVRVVDGDIKLPYGRDMWDAHLGAYSYDTYAPEIEELYQYMSGVEVWGEYNPSVQDEKGKASTLQGDMYLMQAADMGVTHILLPQNALPETVKQAEEILGRKAQIIEGYYLLVLAQ